MKKKLLSILTLLLCLCTAWAGDVYKLQLNGGNKEIINGVTTTGAMTFFTYNSSKHNFNTKFTGCTYDGVSYTSGLKMEGATQVGWTSTSTATVTIVASTWSTNTIKFDGNALNNNNAEEITGGRVFTIEDVEAGSHTVTRGSGENGVFAIYVTEKTEASSAYTVSFNAGEHGTYIGGDIAEASANAGITLPSLTTLEDGYTFNGWYDAATDGTLVGAAGDTYHPNDNITLYEIGRAHV